MKRLLILCLAVLLLTALFLWPGPDFLNSFARTKIIQLGTDYLGVKVTAEEVRVFPFLGEIEVLGLTVANPAGFSDASFAEVGRLRVSADVLSFLSEQGRISEIVASPVQLLIERKGLRFNYQPILERLKQRRKATTASLAAFGSSSLKIDHVLLNDVTARLSLLGNREPFVVDIGTVEIQDLDTSNGSAALLQVLEQLLESAVQGEERGFLANTARSLLESLRRPKQEQNDSASPRP